MNVDTEEFPISQSMVIVTAPKHPVSANARNQAPVFVLGCVRSGTTLLYHMLLSAGNFAVYRVESNAINLLEPLFGDLSIARNRRRLLQAWYKSRLYARSGLDKEAIGVKVMSECRNGGDFLRIVMSEIAMKQGVERWADTTPEHLLYLGRIKETIPDALIQGARHDRIDTAQASIEYLPTRHLICDLSYAYQRRDSNQAGLQFDDDLAAATIKLRF